MRFTISQIDIDHDAVQRPGGTRNDSPTSATIYGRLMTDDGVSHRVELPASSDDLLALQRLADTMIERARTHLQDYPHPA